MKAAIEGSAWPWHQDFGSWHLDGIAKPEMLTVMIALDEATEFNGCLHFLPGTHADGRLNPYFDTSTAWKLWAVTPQDVKAYMKEKAEPVAITGKPGLVAIFHCNLLHASGHNLSPDDRTQAYFCFNRVANRPMDVDKPRPDFVRSTNWVPIQTRQRRSNSGVCLEREWAGQATLRLGISSGPGTFITYPCRISRIIMELPIHLLEPRRHRSRSAITDRLAIDAAYRHDAACCRRDEHFVSLA